MMSLETWSALSEEERLTRLRVPFEVSPCPQCSARRAWMDGAGVVRCAGCEPREEALEA
jgi:hypothetical protein